MSNSTADRNPVELLAEEFAARLRRGEHPSLTEYVERYPEHAADIRDLFPALALVEQFKPARPEGNESLAASLPAARDNLPPQLGDYRILRYLGEGGMRVVYEAVRESLRSHVALKVMHPQYRNRPDYLRRFHTEARSAARLHHTNIVSVFDYGEHDGVCFYAMQYIAGQSLDKVLEDIRQLRREREGLPAGETVTVACDRNSPGQREDMGGADQACCTPRSLRQTVTMGLLTGRFAIPGADENGGEQDTLPPSELAIGHEAEAADLGTATRRFLSELRHAEPVVHRPHELPPASGSAEGSEGVPPHDPSSSLTGKADLRYYREIARLGAQVADALAYAHQRGVLHRDIKPPNLILDPLGNIWVTDFGLAKFEDGNDLSQTQDLVGTLRYMAPERFRGVSDRRGDVYALGATLYELLTLHHPFEGKDQLELIHRIENDRPVPPRKLDRNIPCDLETIVLKALAKDPNHRFASALELAAELRRFVENRPIHSRPIPYYRQFSMWCHRNPWLATANVTAATLTTVLAIVSTFYALTWRHQRNQIASHFRDAREKLFDSLLSQAQAKRSSHRQGHRFDALSALAEATPIATELKLPRGRVDHLRNEAIACMALPDLKKTGRVITTPSGVIACAFDSTMTRYALRFGNGTIQVCRIDDDQKIDRFQVQRDREIFLLFSPDGHYLATTNWPNRPLMVRDVERHAVSLSDQVPAQLGHAAKFSPDSRRIVVAHANGELAVYDVKTGRPGPQLRVPAEPCGLAFRADGTEIAVVCVEKANRICQILDVETRRRVRRFPLLPGVRDVAWSPDGSTLATASDDQRIYLWDALTGNRRATLEGHISPGIVAAFDPSGVLLASDGWEGRIWLWDPVLGRPWLNLNSPIGVVVPSRDGRIVVGSEDKVTIYQLDPALEYRTLAHAASPPLQLSAGFGSSKWPAAGSGHQWRRCALGLCQRQGACFPAHRARLVFYVRSLG